MARYQHITRHHRVIAAPVGSPEDLTTSELHQRVKEVIEPVLAKRDEVLLERLATRLGTGQASTDLDELIGAAAQGRVSDLLVASTTPRWGMPTQPAEYLDQWEPGATERTSRPRPHRRGTRPKGRQSVIRNDRNPIQRPL